MPLVAVVSVAVSSAYKCLLVKASLCLEAAERPQWPRLYSLGRPRSRGGASNVCFHS